MLFVAHHGVPHHICRQLHLYSSRGHCRAPGRPRRCKHGPLPSSAALLSPPFESSGIGLLWKSQKAYTASTGNRDNFCWYMNIDHKCTSVKSWYVPLLSPEIKSFCAPTLRKRGQEAVQWPWSTLSCWLDYRLWTRGTGRENSPRCWLMRGGTLTVPAATSQT